jgi:hypothetical protein
MKRPWWQSLPNAQGQKNQAIRQQYDELKSSVPDWPWIQALKASSNAQWAT